MIDQTITKCYNSFVSEKYIRITKSSLKNFYTVLSAEVFQSCFPPIHDWNSSADLI